MPFPAFPPPPHMARQLLACIPLPRPRRNGNQYTGFNPWKKREGALAARSTRRCAPPNPSAKPYGEVSSHCHFYHFSGRQPRGVASSTRALSEIASVCATDASIHIAVDQALDDRRWPDIIAKDNY